MAISPGAGAPVAVTANVPPVPTTKVAALALVIATVWSTVTVKFCIAGEPTPLLAVIVIG